MTELNIIPECYVDTKVAEILGQASRKYNHQHGCGDVANELIKLKDSIALGIVDQDAKKGPAPNYFSNFATIAGENSLILKKHDYLKQYLILVCPEIENWLMANAAHANIDPVSYNLPDKLKGFIKLTKIKDIDKNDDFKRFIKTLAREKAPGIITLQTWIELFKSNQIDSLNNNKALPAN